MIMWTWKVFILSLLLQCCMAGTPTSFPTFLMTVIDLFAGSGVSGFSGSGGDATAAQLKNPKAVWGDTLGIVYIGEKSNSCIRKVTTSNILLDFAGICNSASSVGQEGIQATASKLSSPLAVTGSTGGVIYFSDGGSNKVRYIAANGIVNLYAGGNTAATVDPGPATSAYLNSPNGLFLTTDGLMYIACYGSNQVRLVSVTGIITVFAGNCSLITI